MNLTKPVAVLAGAVLLATGVIWQLNNEFSGWWTAAAFVGFVLVCVALGDDLLDAPIGVVFALGVAGSLVYAAVYEQQGADGFSLLWCAAGFLGVLTVWTTFWDVTANLNTLLVVVTCVALVGVMVEDQMSSGDFSVLTSAAAAVGALALVMTLFGANRTPTTST